LIATHLPGRTEGQVKNRFYSHIKKRFHYFGTQSQTSDSRNVSEGFSSLSPSSQAEESVFDFDTNVFNGCAQTFANQDLSCVVAKGHYIRDEESVSEGSTAQSPNCQSDSMDPTDVISYSSSEDMFRGLNYPMVNLARQPSFNFVLPSFDNESQIDEMLNRVANYFVDNTPVEANVDCFFSPELNNESNERLEQLSKRKMYLELELARTMNEIKDL
jgi:hypothetical protein